MSDQYEQGFVLTVEESPAGDELILDAVPGATTLAVGDACDFNEVGGAVLLVGDTGSAAVVYTVADLEDDVLTLAAPLVGTWAAGTPVRVQPPAVERRAVVQIEGEGEGVDARVKHALWDRLPLGSRTTGEGEWVTLTLDGSEWVVEDVLAREPMVDGSFIDPDTLPPPVLPPPTDGFAPTASPTPEVIGGIGALFARWTAPANADPLTYEVHVSPVDGFTPNASTLVATTPATSITIRKLPTAIGTPPSDALAYDIIYFFRIVTLDADVSPTKPGPVGAQAGAPMVKITGPDIAVNAVNADRILANTITGDRLSSNVILGSKITTGSIDALGQITGQRVEMDPLGMRVVTAAGLPIINLPTDPNQTAEFNGSVKTQSLTVLGGAMFQSTSNTIATTASLTMASTSNNPNVAPALSSTYDTFPLQMVSRTGSLGTFAINSSRIVAASRMGSQNGMYVAEYVASPVAGTRVWRYDTLGAPVTVGPYFEDFPDYRVLGISRLGALAPVAPGSVVYLMQRVSSGKVLLHCPAQAQPWNDPGIAAGVTDIALGHDSRNLMLAFGGTGTTMTWWLLDPWSNAAGTPPVLAHASGTFAGTWSGRTHNRRGGYAFGTGINWFVVGYRSPSPVFKVYTSSNAGTAADPVWNWPSPSMSGVSMDPSVDPLFSHVIGADGQVRAFTNNWIPAGMYLWAAVTWYDSVGVTHETLPGPVSGWAPTSRALLRAVIPPVPSGAGTVEDPNAFRLYTSNTFSSTPPLATALKMETTITPDPGQSYVFVVNLWGSIGAAPPTTNNFPSATAGLIRSQVTRTAEPSRPRFQVDGGGVATVDGLIPPGTIVLTGATAAPAGWLLCDGAAVSRTTYAELFVTLSTRYGAGNGTSTFNLPNLKGAVPVGLDAAQSEFDTTGKTGGAKSHTHPLSGANAGAEIRVVSGAAFLTFRSVTLSGVTARDLQYQATGGATTATSSNSAIGVGLSGNTDVPTSGMPPFVTLNYIVKT